MVGVNTDQAQFTQAQTLNSNYSLISAIGTREMGFWKQVIISLISINYDSQILHSVNMLYLF
jgi:hypothetical protein